MFHHMSYARSDAQILRKITTFGHARDVAPDWYDERVAQVGRRITPLRNLNPCWPAAYHQIVEQPYEALPPMSSGWWTRASCRVAFHSAAAGRLGETLKTARNVRRTRDDFGSR